MHEKKGGRVSRPPTKTSENEESFESGIRRIGNGSKLSNAVGYSPSQAPRVVRGHYIESTHTPSRTFVRGNPPLL